MLDCKHVLEQETILDLGVASAALATGSPRAPLICEALREDAVVGSARVGTEPLVIGSGDGVGLRLTDPRVSRRHVELRRGEQGVHVADLGSKNGTFLGQARITDAIVTPGASIRIGGTLLRIRSDLLVTLPPSERTRFGRLIGVSRAMRELFALLELAARSEATVLIQGESGTGKELAARELHDHSTRASRPFVIVDCSAIPRELAESTLFGHVKGAFTGAQSQRDGAFVAAHGGTIFLDEIGELPLELQAKLLRVLESRTVQAVGADVARTVDVRVVAATHRDLAAAVRAERFRFDLFYRLAVVQIHLPPLRERPDDVKALVTAFCEERGVAPRFDVPSFAALLQHDWPGNARELRNALERAWVYSGGRPASAEELRFDLGLSLATAPVARGAEPAPVVDTRLTYKEAKERYLAQFDASYLGSLFRECDGNISETARRAELTRRHTRALLRRAGLLDGD